MEKDEYLTFREIYGSAEQLAAEMTRLEGFLYKDSPSDEAVPLRFLTPCPCPTGYEFDENTFHLRLTPLGEFDTSARYLAVSYTWEQNPELERVYRFTAPNYIVWTSKPTFRPPYCPVLVLHRALEFAKTRWMPDRRLIWIDQECIAQSDSEDVETHLRNMHKVYMRSHCTLALLSTPITSLEMYLRLFRLQSRAWLFDSRDPFEAALEAVDDAAYLLEYLVKDRWFTRLWTFNEQRCSSELHYAIVVSLEAGGVLDPVVGSRQAYLDMISSWQTESSSLQDPGARMARITYLNLEHIRGLTVDGLKVANISHDPLHLHPSYVNLCCIINSRFWHGDAKESPSQYVRCNIVIMEDIMREASHLQCSVQADELVIISNAAGLPWGLKTTELDSPDVSYSTCVLVLLSRLDICSILEPADDAYRALRWKDAAERNLQIAREVLDLGIVEYMDELDAIYVDPKLKSNKNRANVFTVKGHIKT